MGQYVHPEVEPTIEEEYPGLQSLQSASTVETVGNEAQQYSV